MMFYGPNMTVTKEEVKHILLNWWNIYRNYTIWNYDAKQQHAECESVAVCRKHNMYL